MSVRMTPNDLPPWEAVYQQTQRWLNARMFEAIVYDLPMLLRLAEGRQEHPTTVILDSRTLQSTPESGERAGYDGTKRKRGSREPCPYRREPKTAGYPRWAKDTISLSAIRTPTS
jgi:transposase